MNGDNFSQQVEAVRQRAAVLYRRGGHELQQPLLMAAFEELHASLEELRVAQEELCQQNGELAVARELVEAERQRYQDLFDFAPDGYLLTDIHGKIQEANRAALMLLGVSQQYLVGKPLIVFVAEESRRDFRCQLNRLVQLDRQEWAVALQPHHSVPFDAALTVTTVRNPAGSAITLRWLLRDITERKRAEQTLLRAKVAEATNQELAKEITERQRAEESLAKRQRYLAVLVEVERKLLASGSDNVYPEILQLLGQVSGANQVYLFENHWDQATGCLLMSQRAQWCTHTLDCAEPSKLQNLSYDDLLPRWAKVLAQGEIIAGPVAALPEPERLILMPECILSILILPLTVDGTFWGFIGFSSCVEACAWESSEVDFLRAAAVAISLAQECQRAQTKIRYQAFHDLVTGLPNRTLFNDRLSVALANARRSRQILAVMFLDLDRFKFINDTLGHTVGDQLLQQVAERVRGCLREGDTVARWGGDEFTLLVSQIRTARDATKLAQRVLESLRLGLRLEGHWLHITGSIGISFYPNDGEDIQTLLRNADTALYRAKEQGRNNYQLYIPAMNSQGSELLVLDDSLHQALERREFLVYYQPQVNVKTGKITRMEALVRWQHPQLGVLSPQAFVPLAEENGLIVPIGEWVLQTACAQFKTWQQAEPSPLGVSVNLSARQFQQTGLVETVAQVLENTGLEPACLELEITETTAMQNLDHSRTIVADLHQMGVYVSMDDFGTGYSSLSHLKKFPLHTIKIDQSFIQDLLVNPQDVAIATAVIALGRGLNLRVVAEGMETKEQVDLLRSLQCEEMQGYWFSRPLPAADATQFLQSWLN